MIRKVDLSENLMDEHKKQARSDTAFFIVLLIMTITLLVIAYLNNFVFMLIQVDGDSMMPTFNTGDVVIVNRTVKPEKGDIVIIEGEKNGAYIIKRVIAVGGETVNLKNGYVYVDEIMIDEPYVIKQGVTQPLGSRATWTLGENQIFFLGDNRLNSKDSRDDDYGECEASQVVGVVEEWSLNIMGVNKFLYGISRR